VRDGVNIFV